MKRRKTSSLCSLLLAVGCWLLVVGCTSDTPKDVVDVDELPQVYPDYVGVTVPVDIAPLNFAMLSDSISSIDVEVKGGKGGSLHENGEYTDFDVASWHRLLAANRGDSLTVTVCARQDGRWSRYRDFTIYVSPDSISAWGITYRRIAPGYQQFGPMGLYQRQLSTFDETPLIDNRWSAGTCVNCHTANQTNPDQYVFHARVDHGATVVYRDGEIEALQSKNDSLGGTMVYPCWHPGGRYIAFSTNKTSQMFHLSGPKRIEVYDSSSDVFVYDTQTQTILADTIIMKKLWAENTPAFSPDGQWLYFTTARRQVYPTDFDKEKYSLCRVGFDAQTGRIGQQVDTLISADLTGKSVTWPRPSYDGKYIMYARIDYGYFSVWHPEADLWLLDLQTGTSRPLDEVNSPRAESLHSWSANSRWFLFTSRRDDGLYTRVYFASIDEEGRATKPFMLPQRNPKDYYRQLLDSYNTPDFTLRPVSVGAQQVRQLLENHTRDTVRWSR
jgi:hypothetical protein